MMSFRREYGLGFLVFWSYTLDRGKISVTARIHARLNLQNLYGKAFDNEFMSLAVGFSSFQAVLDDGDNKDMPETITLNGLLVSVPLPQISPCFSQETFADNKICKEGRKAQ